MTIGRNKTFKLISILLSMLMANFAWALDRNGNGTHRNEAVVLYTFDAGSGSVIYDKSTIGQPLNLQVAHNPSTSVLWGPGELLIKEETLLRTAGPATKIINQCKGSNEITIEAWIENQVQNDFVADVGPLRIATLSRGADNTDFFLGQNYDGNHFYQAGVRNANNMDFNNEDGNESEGGMRVAANVLKHDEITPPYQHVYFTRNKDGVAKLYVSDKSQIPILRATTNIGGNFSNWNNNAVFALGNEINAFNDAGQPLVRGNLTHQDRPWRGTYHMVAVYCRSLTQSEILGARNPENWLSKNTFPINPSTPITSERILAQKIYKRIVGLSTPVDNPVLSTMESDIRSGDYLAAAARVSGLPGFYNRTVKDFAKRMSNRDESVGVPLNDFAATVVGHVRDQGDARELTYGNFYYRANPDRAAVPSDLIEDILTSNNHYSAIERLNYNLADPQVLVKVNGQKLYNGAGNVVNHKDPAGLITTRAFTSSHAVAGTNRRMVEFSFRQFLCRPIKKWADNTGADAMVGRDVDRFPGGSHVDYQTTCRGCHSQMDPLRQAFGRITFENGFTKHTFAVSNGDDEEDMASTAMDSATLIVEKMNRNNDTFPGGWISRDTKWKNNITGGLNSKYFRWNPNNMSGNGIGDFGRMISSAGAFPDCMAQRVFRSVCKRETEPFDETMIKYVAEKFATEDNYNLKKLFERIAVTPNCLGN